MAYEHILRLIGHWMDERRPDHVRMLETPEGFVVAWQWGHDLRAAVFREFSHQDLVVLGRQERGARYRDNRSDIQGPGQARATKYENVWRALGHELDAASAAMIMLEELNDNLLVTYQYRDPSAAMWRKHMAVVSAEKQLSLVKESCARRYRGIGLSARLGDTSGRRRP